MKYKDHNSIVVNKLLSKFIENKESLSQYITINGFKNKVNNAFRSLNSIANGTYDGQEYIDDLYAEINDEYLLASYYTEMNKEEDYTGELVICSYNIEILFWDLKNNQLHFFNKFHSNGDDVLDECNNFYTIDYKTTFTIYSITKYYIENQIPKFINKQFKFDSLNYSEKNENTLVHLIDELLMYKTNSDFLPFSIKKRIKNLI